SMSLHVEQLNGDSTFLLTFAPPFAPEKHAFDFPGSFTVLVDPWLSGTSSILHPKFQISRHVCDSTIKSLAELKRQPDLILVSQDKPDHCHRETLCSLPRECKTLILATPAAAKKIRSWNHFAPGNVQIMRPYASKHGDHTVRRIPIAPFSTTSTPGEVTIANIATRFDLTNLHNAIGITYTPPGTTLKTRDGSHAAKTFSIVYTPHGLSYRTLQPYIERHLAADHSLPVDALFHSINLEQNPKLMGGLVANGAPGGTHIASALQARHWISAHDEAKDNRGWATTWIKSRHFTKEHVERLLADKAGKVGRTEVHVLGTGGRLRIGPSSDDTREDKMLSCWV
ncbi:hypothetical protein K431DRAFT_232612, partial [Polychaeton citri CBS 116435]